MNANYRFVISFELGRLLIRLDEDAGLQAKALVFDRWKSDMIAGPAILRATRSWQEA